MSTLAATWVLSERDIHVFEMIFSNYRFCSKKIY